jgi:hypothetical protein
MSHGKFNLKLLSLVSLLSIALYVCAPSLGQGRIAERLGHRFNAGSQIITKDNNGLSYRQVQLAGLNVAIWEPNSFLKPVPLIIF